MRIRKEQGYWLNGQKIIFRNKQSRVVMQTDEVPLLGQHNIANVMASIATAHYLGISLKTIRQRVKSFRGVPERLETIRKIRHRTFIDDTTATSPEATECALKSVERPVVLIAGGTNKGLNYEKLAKTVTQAVHYCILLPGSATKLIIKQFKLKGFKRYIGPVRSMKAAVAQAIKNAPAHSTILLSPGAASFGLFKNEFDRGRQFTAIVRNLK